MSEYFYWPYRLKLGHRGDLNARTPDSGIEGALLCHRKGGHACLQPWPSLGQGTLSDSLELLREGGDSALLASCRRCIALDRGAREAGESLFDGKIVPQSHLTVPDRVESGWLEEKKSAGFELFKLKCGSSIRDEVAKIQALCERFGDQLQLRLDFNECLDPAGFCEFVDMLGEGVSLIDFVEDPVPYDGTIWQDLSANFPFDLAVDRAGADAVRGFGVRVTKPAWGAVPSQGPERVVITSAMDHPLGQLFAAYEASVFKGNTDDCGLLTHWLFEPGEFSEALGVVDRRLVPPGGAGLGFGSLLDRLPWRAL